MIDILYQDNQLLFCVKPSGVTSEADGMVKLLSEQLGCSIYPVHRLDKPVGGVMVYAKTSESASKLSAQFSSHETEKTYLCVVKGKPTDDSAIFTDLLYKDVRTNKTYVVDRPRKGVKEASLEYQTMATVNAEDGVLSLLKVKLHTGRSHQIRVQFASRKLPLLGDSRYGGKCSGLDVCLWSHSLTVTHPKTCDRLTYSVYPSSDYPWNEFV